METIKTKMWNIQRVEKEIELAFKNNSEVELLKILKENSFLFYELYSRKYGIRPNFCEIEFGGTLRCDFAWLNDNSSGPEWVLVEIEKPKMKIFTKNNKPSAELNNAIEQVKSWQRYFDENPYEKKRIFGAVAKFRYILVAGDEKDWQKEFALKWRVHHNSTSNIEIRTTNVFKRALTVLKERPDELWSFEENPNSLRPSELQDFWKNCNYMNRFRILS